MGLLRNVFNGELNVKARLVVKGFQKDNSDILSD